MRIVIVIEGKGLADESSKAIEQECKKCGKKFRNVGYAYCSKDCELMDNWNYIEIWKCYRFHFVGNTFSSFGLWHPQL